VGGKRGERESGFVFESGLGVVLGVVLELVECIIRIRIVEDHPRRSHAENLMMRYSADS